MEIQKDFKELLELFNAHNVEYMIFINSLRIKNQLAEKKIWPI